MAAKTYNLQNTIFDLDTFSEVTVGKTYEFENVTSHAEALSRLGNDNTKLLKVINDGLRAEIQRQHRTAPDGWRTFDDNDALNGPFEGTVADIKKVNALVLTLAKTVFAFDKNMTKEQKASAKDSAKAMIQGTPTILEGLKKSASMTADEGETEEAEA